MPAPPQQATGCFIATPTPEVRGAARGAAAQPRPRVHSFNLTIRPPQSSAWLSVSCSAGLTDTEWANLGGGPGTQGGGTGCVLLPHQTMLAVTDVLPLPLPLLSPPLLPPPATTSRTPPPLPPAASAPRCPRYPAARPWGGTRCQAPALPIHSHTRAPSFAPAANAPAPRRASLLLQKWEASRSACASRTTPSSTRSCTWKAWQRWVGGRACLAAGQTSGARRSACALCKPGGQL